MAQRSDDRSSLSSLELELEQDLSQALSVENELNELEAEVDDQAGAYQECELGDAEESLEASSQGELDEEAGDDAHWNEVLEDTTDRANGGFASRFYELSLREFESEMELDNEVRQLIAEMEQEFFLGSLAKKITSAGKSLIKKGVQYAKKNTPIGQIIRTVTKIPSGGLSGLLSNVAKTALGALSSHPAFAAVMPALSALGFNPAAGAEGNQAAWGQFVQMAKDAYGQLGQTLHQEADDPVEGTRLATQAFEMAMRKVRRPSARASTSRMRLGTRVIHLGPGEEVIIRRR